MRKKLLLINPAAKGQLNMSSMSLIRFPPLNLGYLAALTPQTWDVKVVDENIRAYSGEEADLVGMTSLTNNAPRAYEIAAQLGEKRIPIILGGVHASFRTKEAKNFVDSVVVGEGFGVWPRIIRDFEAEELQEFYNGSRGSLDGLVFPRRDVYSRGYN